MRLETSQPLFNELQRSWFQTGQLIHSLVHHSAEPRLLVDLSRQMRKSLIAIEAIVTFVSCFCMTIVATGASEADPPSEDTTTSSQLSVSRDLGKSSISIPIRTPLAVLQTRLNEQMPPELKGDVPFSLGGADHTHTDFVIHPGTLALSPAADGAVGFSAEATANGAAHYNFKFIHNHTRFNAAARVFGMIRPELQADWTIRPNLQFQVDVHQANLNIGNLSVKSLIFDQINHAVPGYSTQITEALNRSLALRDRVAAFWSSAFRAISLSSNPDCYASLTPRSVTLVQPHCNPDGSLSSEAEIKCDLAMFVGNRPNDPPVTPLPQPNFAPSLEPNFHLFVPVTLSMSELAVTFKSKLADTALPIDGDHQITITQIAFEPRKDALQVQFWLSATTSSQESQSFGQVLLVGNPVLHNNGETLAFDSLDYTVDTKNELLNVAAWLLKPLALQQLQTALTLDLAHQLTPLNEVVNRELTEKLRSQTFQPRLEIKSLRATEAVIAGRDLILAFETTGECEATISL